MTQLSFSIHISKSILSRFWANSRVFKVPNYVMIEESIMNLGHAFYNHRQAVATGTRFLCVSEQPPNITIVCSSKKCTMANGRSGLCLKGLVDYSTSTLLLAEFKQPLVCQQLNTIKNCLGQAKHPESRSCKV
jgi:hypothetical protein